MIHDPGCTCGAYACELRAKGVSVSPAATPNRRNAIPPRKNDVPNYNKQVRGEERAGGSFMPYLHADMTPIRQKEFEHRRHELTDIRRRQTATTQEG